MYKKTILKLLFLVWGTSLVYAMSCFDRDKHNVTRIDTIIYELKTQNEDIYTCAICLQSLSGITTKKYVSVIYPCYHMFHEHCLTAWIKQPRRNKQQADCPLCHGPIGATKTITVGGGSRCCW